MSIQKRFSPNGTERLSLWLSTTNTSKLIRKALKGAFPGIKFSVISSNYAGGSSVSIGWFDGPTSLEVDDVVKRFAGSTFDSMTDCKNYVQGSYAGISISFGPDFVFTNRRNSKEAVERALDEVFRDATIREECNRPEVDSAETGSAWCDSNEYVKSRHEPLDRIVNRQISATSFGGPYPGLAGCSDSIEDLLPFLNDEEKAFVTNLPESEKEEPLEVPPSNPEEALQQIAKTLEGWEFEKTGDEWPRRSLFHPESGARVDAYVVSKEYHNQEWEAELAEDFRFELRVNFPKGYTPPYSEIQSEAWKIRVSALRDAQQAARDIERRLLTKLLALWDEVKRQVRAKKIQDAQIRNMSEFLCRISGGKVPQHHSDRSTVIGVWLQNEAEEVLAGEIQFRLAEPKAKGGFEPAKITIGGYQGGMSGIPLREGIKILKILRGCGEPR